MCLRIHNCNNIHITSACFWYITIDINTTDINCKWFFYNTVICCSCWISEIQLNTYIKCIQHFHFIAIAIYCFFHQTCICTVINDCITISINQSLILFHFNRINANLLFNISYSCLYIVSTFLKLYTIRIVCRIFYCLCRIICSHCNNHLIYFIVAACDLSNHIISLSDIITSCKHHNSHK